MLVGAAFLVLALLGMWPPETGLDRSLAGLTVAAVLHASSLAVHEWRQGRMNGSATEALPVMANTPGDGREHRSASFSRSSSVMKAL